MLAVPFSAVGAIWLFHLLGYNVSIAAWVGMIALLGLDAETGVFMLLFLDLSYDEREEARPAAQRARARRGDRPRRGQAGAAEDDDGGGGVHGPAADHVVDLGRRRRDEAHRRADDRRAGDLVPRSSCWSTRRSTSSGRGAPSCASSGACWIASGSWDRKAKAFGKGKVTSRTRMVPSTLFETEENGKCACE